MVSMRPCTYKQRFETELVSRAGFDQRRSVAQSVEHGHMNCQVAGSIPARVTFSVS